MSDGIFQDFYSLLFMTVEAKCNQTGKNSEL